MDQWIDYLKQLSRIIRTEIFVCENEIATPCERKESYHPISSNRQLCGLLRNLCDSQEVPVLYQDAHHVLWGAVKYQEKYIFIGPMDNKGLNKIELHRYYQEYGKDVGAEKMLPFFSLSQILAIMQIVTLELLGREYQEELLIRENHLARGLENGMEEDILRFQIEEDLAEAYHHSYQEELRLLGCVREGRVEDALQYNMGIDAGTGRLSKKEVNHWRKVVIVAVTLCTRAAIEGGVSPAAAYQLSDYYIQKCDEYNSVPALIECRNLAVKQLAQQVRERNESRGNSNYVDKCKDYVSKHYKEKIYLDEIASALGLSSTYLSRIFSKETGMRLQDYINWFKVERAANLLLYSEESIAHIGEYVNFPTQSYFGKIFKKYKNMTPKEYQNRYKPTEFVTEDNAAK